MHKAFFVTGTDTNIGKTLAAVALLQLASEQGLKTTGLKPVAAGAEEHAGQKVNTDAWELQQNSSTRPAYHDVNPVLLHAAIAPHIAAAREGRSLTVAGLAEHCQRMLEQAEFSVIEGAGGWLVPLNSVESMADLATRLGCPVILVVGLRLGCINHALLTAAAIKNAGLQLAGWIANQVDPEMAVSEENISTLKERLAAPLIGRVPWTAGINAQAFARHLDLKLLLK